MQHGVEDENAKRIRWNESVFLGIHLSDLVCSVRMQHGVGGEDAN